MTRRPPPTSCVYVCACACGVSNVYVHVCVDEWIDAQIRPCHHALSPVPIHTHPNPQPTNAQPTTPPPHQVHRRPAHGRVRPILPRPRAPQGLVLLGRHQPHRLRLRLWLRHDDAAGRHVGMWACMWVCMCMWVVGLSGISLIGFLFTCCLAPSR